MGDPEDASRLVEAFQLMWGNFPEPMLLVRRDRTILAVNDASAAQGTLAGRKCFSYNPDPAAVEEGACRGCQAERALDAGTAVTCQCQLGGRRAHGYWIPVKGSREVYLHGFAPSNSALLVLG